MVTPPVRKPMASLPWVTSMPSATRRAGRSGRAITWQGRETCRSRIRGAKYRRTASSTRSGPAEPP